MKDNQRGSTLLWAVIIIMVLLILVGAGLGISFSYFNRSLQYEVKQQTYFTAHSGMEAVINAINEETEANKKLLIPKNTDEEVVITDISFQSSGTKDENLGVATAVIKRIDEKHLKISVTGNNGGQSYNLYADMAYVKNDVNVYYWMTYQMYDDNTTLVKAEEKTE